MKDSRLDKAAENKSLFYEVTHLELWHVFDMVCAGYKPFDQAMACWTRFGKYLRASALPRPTYPEFVAALQAIYERSIEEGIDHAVDEAMEYAFPIITNAIDAQRRPGRRGRGVGRSFGCFRYDVSEPRRAQLHFRNAVRPKSPFGDMKALFCSLRDLIADIRRITPQVETVCCGSWVNNLRAFRKLFPDSYLDSLTPTSPDNKTHGGWWGQFANRQGKLNQQRAQILKTQRRFEFAELEGECTLTELARHIDKMLESPQIPGPK